MEHWQTRNSAESLYNKLGGVPQSVAEPTLTSLANELADALVSLRAGITNLRSELSAVCVDPFRGANVAPSETPQHSASALAQIQTLIEQINGARQDVRDVVARRADEAHRSDQGAPEEADGR